MQLRIVSTNGIASGDQFAEALFQTVQEALYPHIPQRATEWFTQVTLVDLYLPWRDPAYKRVGEGCWRMLMLYAVQDLCEVGNTYLAIADLARMLNTIKSARGRQEVVAVCEALLCIQRTYPQAFVSVHKRALRAEPLQWQYPVDGGSHCVPRKRRFRARDYPQQQPG